MRSQIVLCVIAFLTLAGLAGAETVLWVPAAASNPGLNDTQWSTDLWIVSHVTDAPIEVYAAFCPDQAGTTEPAEVTVEVPDDQVLQISDAVATLFGESRPGAIRLRSEHPFWAQSRTFNDGGDNGTYGQGIPATPPPPDVEPNGEGYKLLGGANRPGPDGVRTNIGIVNTGDASREVMVAIRESPSGEVLGGARVDIGPHGWYQADVFELVGAGDRIVEVAEVGTLSLAGETPDSLLTYLSRVDNRSGDGTFVMGYFGEVIRILPHPWEVRLSLTYTVSVTVSELTHTAPDGSSVTVANPASGFDTGTLEFMSPATFCWSVTGQLAGGSVTVRVSASDDTGQASLRTSGQDGGDTIDLSDCLDLY